MPRSVLEAIRQGDWDFEPDVCELRSYQATRAIPGSLEKLRVLCERVQRGLPLWHPDDRSWVAQSESRGEH